MSEKINEEITLLEMIKLILNHFYKLVGSAFLGGILGLVIAVMIPAKWEAGALIRVGQFGSSNGIKGSEIEPTLQVVDRIKSKSFQNDVLKNLGISTDESDDEANDFRDALKVKLEKSDLIALSIRCDSPEKAKKNLSAVIAEVKQAHKQLLTPTLDRLNLELASIEQDLKKASAESERLVKSLDGRTDSLNDKSFSQAALLSNILLTRESELRNLRERKREIEDILSPERTFVTREIGRIEVADKPAFPKKSLFSIFGSFIGLLLTVLWILLNSDSSKSNSIINNA